MKKNFIPLFLALWVLSTCGGEEPPREAAACVPAEDCFLCGRAEESPWGQNNIGIISLNTFEIMPVGINRYDDGGWLIEENTGCVRMRSFQSRENGFRGSGMEDPDRGYAILTVTLGEDGAADREKAAAFLCEECLERIGAEGIGLGAVDLITGEVRAFDKQTKGFGLGDFYIHCDWEGEEKLELLVFYSPLR